MDEPDFTAPEMPSWSSPVPWIKQEKEEQLDEEPALLSSAPPWIKQEMGTIEESAMSSSAPPWIKQENEESSSDDESSDSDDSQEDYEFNNDQLLPPIKKEEVVEEEKEEQDIPFPPVLLDPRCRSNIPELAALWPVYVSNFYCPQAADRDRAIRKCFAEKGLNVRWWFRRMDEYYYNFQLKVGLYDMLVYFGSEAEALQAIRTCNRGCYLGHTVNVLPGREPVYFPIYRSLYTQNGAPLGLEFSEEFFESRMRRWGIVNCVVNFDMCSGVVEMAGSDKAAIARLGEPLLNLQHVSTNVRKQRYLESDVLELIESFLAGNLHVLKPNPLFINQWQRPATAVTSKPPKKKIKHKRHFGGRKIGKAKKRKNYRRMIEQALANGKLPHCRSKQRNKRQLFQQAVEEVLMKRGIKSEEIS